MRRFTKYLHHIVSAVITFLDRVVDRILPSRQQPVGAPPVRRHKLRIRRVHAVPFVAVLALGATAFAVNSGASPDAPTQIAVGDQVPHSTPTTQSQADLKLQADIEKLAAAQERAELEKAVTEKFEAAKAAEKKAAEKKAAKKAAEEQAAQKRAEEKAAAERAAAEAAEQAEAERAAAAAAAEPAPASEPVSASGACGGNLPPCCVMMRESGGNPTVVNSSSGAAGKWQFMTSTWANYKGYPTAAHAPEHIQDERAAQLWAGGAGAGHWGGGCW